MTRQRRHHESVKYRRPKQQDFVPPRQSRYSERDRRVLDNPTKPRAITRRGGTVMW